MGTVSHRHSRRLAAQTETEMATETETQMAMATAMATAMETETETETETNAETWDAESAFDELWNAYPAKGRVKRPMSQQYFLDKIRSAKAFTVILAAVKGKWAKSEKWAKGFVMALPSFIDQESWLEDPEPAGGTQTVAAGPVYRRWEPPKATAEDTEASAAWLRELAAEGVAGNRRTDHDGTK